MKCKKCRWWFQKQQTKEEAGQQAPSVFGLCKRLPPVPWNFKTWWPEVEPDDWCGEFKEKDNEQKE